MITGKALKPLKISQKSSFIAWSGESFTLWKQEFSSGSFNDKSLTTKDSPNRLSQRFSLRFPASALMWRET